MSEIKHEIKQSSKEYELIVKDKLNIQNAKYFKELLDDLLKKTDHLILDIEQVEEIDISVLQLIFSLDNTIKSKQKVFELRKKFALTTKNIIKMSGFSCFECFTD